MEATVLIDRLGVVLVMAGAFYVLLLRPWRPIRLLQNLTPSVDLLFVASLAMGAVALHQPEPFDRTALWLVDRTDLPETLNAVDARITAIETLPERLWADLTQRLGWAVEAPPEDPDGAAPIGHARAAVMPAVVGIAAGLLRCGAFAGSLLAIALCQAMRIAAGARRALRSSARASRSELEARVAALEDALQTLHAPDAVAPASVEP